MSRVLFLFLDGVGLGLDDPLRNPLSAASMPKISALLGGSRLVAQTAPFHGDEATLLALDARLGIEGTPQSASGQATILTGRNVPAEIGRHYGPKPNPPIRRLLESNNLFSEVARGGGSSALLNAYPPGYFESIRSQRRLYSAIPLAATAAGLRLRTAADLKAGQALSPDFTGQGWSARSDFPPAPVYTAEEAGSLLAQLSLAYDLAWFDYWPSDYAGHRGSMEMSLPMLETFDTIMGALHQAWANRRDLVVVISDHGNLEDMEKRGHTLNPVPAMLIGPPELRRQFSEDLVDLTGVFAATLKAVFN